MTAAYDSSSTSEQVLSNHQLRQLAKHRYSACGQSLLEPYMQPFWTWLVERIPLWWAPNAITLIGLAFNGITTFILMLYSPTASDECPQWSYILCAFGLFIYQSMDAIDGKQARRTNSSSPLGELFDHGCDALSMVFVAIGTCVTVRVGIWPTIFFCECFGAMFIYYAAHWQTYCSGILHFGRFDVTEAQIVIIFIYSITGLFGPRLWDVEIALTGLPLRILPVLVSVVNGAVASFIYFPVVYNGGVGKNGSTIAGTSVLSPLIPMGLLMSMAYAARKYSTVDIFERHSVLFTMAFGFAASKLSNRLVIAYMSRSEMSSLDSSFVGPLLMLVNQYLGVLIDEYIMLWLCFIYCAIDLLRFATAVCTLLCSHLQIHCFQISSVTVSRSSASTVTMATSSPAEAAVRRHRVMFSGALHSTNGVRH